jgi:dTDP-4-amino-4,6-dideoxygalactose transaminase
MPKIDNVPYIDIYRAHKEILPELKKNLENMILRGNTVLGSNVLEFEKSYAKFSNVKYAAGVANGLDALILSLISLEIGIGDEVIVPSNTYIATLLAISRVGAIPVLVEPNIETYNIDVSRIHNKISKRTKGIIPVHLFGQACEVDEIVKISRKNKLFVIEDNAQSHGASFNQKITGSFGDINATSFYPGKNFGALGDAGAITTNSKKLYEKILMIRNYGSKEKYLNELKGYNSRLDELQAGFLQIKLKHLKSKNKKRQVIAKIYNKNLDGVGDIILPKTAMGATHVYHVFTVRTKRRDELKKHLFNNKINTMIHYPVPPHLQKAYKDLGYKKGDFPIAEELAQTSLSIPIFPEMNKNEQEYVINSIKKFYAK